jgi:arginine N-succinyltransferase
MLLLRDAQPGDLPGLLRLARVLNSVNLPHDRKALAAIVDRSTRSFRGAIANPLERHYVFVLEEPRRGGPGAGRGGRGSRILGTSMVIAQHGTRESPCTFFEISEREHYSGTLDRHFRHRVLSLGYHFDGPTEIGGLVVDPRQRGRPGAPGRQLSLVRFLYIAAFRERFRDTVLAELMPPLTPDGRSLFWESCGRRFTGLDYQTADKKSRENKEFIQQLFPPSDLYATLLPPRVQKLLGAVGRSTRAAELMLWRSGFRPVGRIDPFDGGPHYECRTDDIAEVKALRRLAVAPQEPGRSAGEWLVGASSDGRVRFRAVRTPARAAGGEIRLPAEARGVLQVNAGGQVVAVPLA